MRNPTVRNKFNLTMSDVKKLKVIDRSKVHDPLFWRNNAINAWCIIGSTMNNWKDRKYGTYNEYWLGIYDEDSSRKIKFRVNCNSYGGMCGYNFKEFFNYREIENEDDLEIQEKLLSKINELIDEGILSR